MLATLSHTTARITRSTTHVHTNINNKDTNTATNHKDKTCTGRSMEKGGDGVVRGARVLNARSTGCASETCWPEKTEAGEAEQTEPVVSPQPSVVHVGVRKLGEPRSCCPGASPSCVCRRPSRTLELVQVVMLPWIFPCLGKSRTAIPHATGYWPHSQKEQVADRRSGKSTVLPKHSTHI